MIHPLVEASPLGIYLCKLSAATGYYASNAIIASLISWLSVMNVYANQPTVEFVPADPEAGFNFPYILRSPTQSNKAKQNLVLLVETNNTGNNDDYQQQVEAARYFAANKGIGPVAAQKLGAPLLVPVFPRTEVDAHVYTHALDRDTLKSTDKNSSD